jgi:DNA-binding IclR family transcriptional regulator
VVNADHQPVAGSKTLDNGLRVLNCIAENPQGLTVTQLADRLALHRTVLYRLLLTLGSHEMLVQLPDGSYRLGLGATRLAARVRPDLRSAALGALQRLAEATNATAHLTVLDGDDAVSLAVVEPLNAVAHVAYRVGARHPLSRGAAGMAILLGRPPEPGERAAIRRARRLGYIASHGEIEAGAWGLAAPILAVGAPATASVGVVALSALDPADIAELVLGAAAEVARRLG